MSLLKNIRRAREGFSLVEMSITLLITALALASIIGGAHLMEVARINKIAGKLSFYKQATTDFQAKYAAYPGDMPNADEFWSGVDAGDGNNRVDDTVNLTCQTECLAAWEHLGKANMVNSLYTGAVGGTPSGYEVGANVPESSVKSAFFFLKFAELYGESGNIIQLSTGESDGPDEGAVSAETARNIDKKYDDASPSGGGFLAARPASRKDEADVCVNADYSTATSADYVLSDTSSSCRIIVRINAE